MRLPWHFFSEARPSFNHCSRGRRVTDYERGCGTRWLKRGELLLIRTGRCRLGSRQSVLCGMDPFDEVGPLLQEMLEAKQAPAVISSAIDTLAKFDDGSRADDVN